MRPLWSAADVKRPKRPQRTARWCRNRSDTTGKIGAGIADRSLSQSCRDQHRDRQQRKSEAHTAQLSLQLSLFAVPLLRFEQNFYFVQSCLFLKTSSRWTVGQWLFPYVSSRTLSESKNPAPCEMRCKTPFPHLVTRTRPRGMPAAAAAQMAVLKARRCNPRAFFKPETFDKTCR